MLWLRRCCACGGCRDSQQALDESVYRSRPKRDFPADEPSSTVRIRRRSARSDRPSAPPQLRLFFLVQRPELQPVHPYKQRRQVYAACLLVTQPPTSAPRLGSPRPHLRGDWARPTPVCATGFLRLWCAIISRQSFPSRCRSLFRDGMAERRRSVPSDGCSSLADNGLKGIMPSYIAAMSNLTYLCAPLSLAGIHCACSCACGCVVVSLCECVLSNAHRDLGPGCHVPALGCIALCG